MHIGTKSFEAMTLEIFNDSLFEIADKWTQTVTNLISKTQKMENPLEEMVLSIIGGLY